MSQYRLFLLSGGDIVTCQDFRAGSDEMASQAATIVFDDCADRCDSAEVWDGIRLIADASALRGRAIIAAANKVSASADPFLDELKTEIETIVARIEEAAITAGELHSSERLKEWLEVFHGRHGRSFASRNTS